MEKFRPSDITNELMGDFRRRIIQLRKDWATTRGTYCSRDIDWYPDEEKFIELARKMSDKWSFEPGEVLSMFVENEAVDLIMKATRNQFDFFAVLGRATMFVRAEKVTVAHVRKAMRRLRKEQGTLRLSELDTLQLACAASEGRVLVRTLPSFKKVLLANPLYRRHKSRRS